MAQPLLPPQSCFDGFSPAQGQQHEPKEVPGAGTAPPAEGPWLHLQGAAGLVLRQHQHPRPQAHHQGGAKEEINLVLPNAALCIPGVLAVGDPHQHLPLLQCHLVSLHWL